MARSATNPAARLRDLAVAKERTKALKRGETLTAAPMADLLRVSWPVLRTWCDDVPELAQSDAFSRGGNGIEWSFDPRKTVAALSRHFGAKQEAGRKRARRIKAMVAGDALDSAGEDFDLDEIGKMLRLSRELQEAKIQQGRLVDAEKSRSAVRAMCSEMQEAVLRSAQEQDPTGRWPVDFRESFEDAVQKILLAMEQAGQKCLDRLNGGPA